MIRDYGLRLMEDARRRLSVSLALKAARYLAGGLDDKGRPAAVSTAQLAQREPLVENGITKNRLEEFEQLKASARPMELQQISRGLGGDLEPLIALTDHEQRTSAEDRLAGIEEKLDQLLTQRKAAQERLSRIAPEEAEDALEMLTELRSLAARVGREVPKRGAQAANAKDRQQRRAANGGA